ncbi:hypothetical protein MF672_019075 [Actinomadura sp. ATCC 31491]|uniref:DUF4175 domain-containing protein n=1 Tax=Actinomadura luzonensis TaxID=2805427 RepID=A0ABT0FU66_9ACTN|nr:hypothetical protein [Actinomadura luzonensis]MCK2215882.1 hypothetical protein [Actinomadura luzonensis]
MALSAERKHQIGTALVWVAMWTGTGLILRGHGDEFGSMIPLLAAGSFVGLALPGHQGMRAYLIGTLTVWAALLVATAIVLSGTAFLGPMMALLAAGAAYFVLVVPIYLIISWPGRADGDRH